ncbi:MAG: hypothetical protein GXY55_05030 [Phycisphaerae bacterium]|nr:hypothetical protein [Phycisphaerae bacterium]
MNYRPNTDKLFLWDTWMFPDPDGRRMHLYFLANRKDECWEWAGHAVSEDLVHWEELPAIQIRRPGDTFDVGAVGTGMVFAAPSGGFMMSYTSNLGKPQGICFLHSNDLVHWDKRWQEPCFVAQGPHYETDGRKCICNPPAFRDAYIHKVGDHYEALIGAHATHGPVSRRGCIARYKSTDPELRRWEPMPPLFGPGVAALMEVPEHFQIGQKHYVLWSNASWLALTCDTRTRRQCTGTFYAISDSYEGPYTVPADHLLIGCSQTSNAYVGRVMPWKGDVLLYHQNWWPCVATAFPKRLVQEEDGTLKAAYWPGVEKVHRDEVRLALDDIALQGEFLGAGKWEKTGQGGLKISSDGGSTLALVPARLQDVHLRCSVTVESGSRFAITLRDGGHANKRKEDDPKTPGVAIQGDLQYGQWHFGTVEHSWASRIDLNEVIFEAPERGKTYRLDLFVRDIYFEAYVDGIWKFTRNIHDKAPRGGIGFYIEDGTAAFENIQVWTLEPINHPYPG